MKYTLPKGYLSYSSMNLWWSSKDQYRMKYYSTDSYDIDTVYTRFGKQIALTLESKEKTKAHPVLSTIPLYPQREYPLLHEIEGVPIKGFIDSFDKRHKKIIEIKTGIRKDNKKPWDAVRVRKHEQVLLYSLLVKDLLGSVHPVVKLIWLETAWKEVCQTTVFGQKEFQSCAPDLALTGHFEVFDRVIEDWEHDRMRQLIVQTATEISEDYSRYLKFSTA
jgi:hypothetical protein